jgi:hypothetical protein
VFKVDLQHAAGGRLHHTKAVDFNPRVRVRFNQRMPRFDFGAGMWSNIHHGLIDVSTTYV